MASVAALPKRQSRAIEAMVARFVERRDTYAHFAKTVHMLLSEHSDLRPHIHSVKYRVKDADHLRLKLRRKAEEARALRRRFDITPDNVFQRVGDLAGVRILHLNTTQMEEIDKAVRKILGDESYRIVEGPVANTWDDEYRGYFRSINIRTTPRPSMYTSVHYVIESGARSSPRCELQVRTLVEEVWGEVSHTVNYPEETKSVACREQLRVLARVSSSCTRLVDSIFASHKEHADAVHQRATKSRVKRSK
jgi:putative GTP pyrophosphokinase